MRNNKKYVDALEYFEESGYGLANEYDNDSAIEIVEELQELGCVVRAEIDGDEEFIDALFITLPKKVTSEHVVYIAYIRPDEISEEESGELRLWWD